MPQPDNPLYLCAKPAHPIGCTAVAVRFVRFLEFLRFALNDKTSN